LGCGEAAPADVRASLGPLVGSQDRLVSDKFKFLSNSAR
jgi:hypothetical protein